MNKRYRLGTVSAIPYGEGRNYKVGEQEIAVFRARDGGVFATQSHCPHRKGPLADGLLGAGTLVCPLHEWSFDLATGKPLHGTACSGIAVYPVAQGPGEELWLEMPEDQEPN